MNDTMLLLVVVSCLDFLRGSLKKFNFIQEGSFSCPRLPGIHVGGAVKLIK